MSGFTLETRSRPRSCRLIDGSKSCAQLLEEHLEECWGATIMNLSIDRKCRIDGFMYGDFYLEFKFSRRDEDFMVLACLYHPKENGPVEDLHEKVHTARQKITDKSIRLIQTDDGGIVLTQTIQAASVLVDEEIELALVTFFDTASSIRKEVMPKRTRRLSFF